MKYNYIINVINLHFYLKMEVVVKCEDLINENSYLINMLIVISFVLGYLFFSKFKTIKQNLEIINENTIKSLHREENFRDDKECLNF